MKNPTHFERIRFEEEHKEHVYRSFEIELQESQKLARHYAGVLGLGEEQESFQSYGAYSSAETRRTAVETKLKQIYKRPYFAHVQTRDTQGEIMHYFLSDNESLDTARIITDGDNKGLLLPFKLDSKRPISSAMFSCYQTSNGQPVSVMGVDGKVSRLTPELICDDEIENRKLLNVVQKYPVSEEYTLSADELLEQKLQDNRSNPALRNIIATLQQNQFDIIRTDYRTSFVVQGCAGSGKSQCLLHRLFFLRDQLSQDGWNHVLLLTPTQLFRNYSAELIRRYQLSDIHDYSLAELYRSLLNEYDPRFKYRQYVFELSEEYLPDAYLQEVYDHDTIRRISEEIDSSIKRYVQEGCRALETEPPQTVLGQNVKQLVKKLEEAIKAYDTKESSLQNDPAYITRRQDYEKDRKELEAVRKSLERCLEDQEKFRAEEEKFRELLDRREKTREERALWLRNRGQKLAQEREELERLSREMDQGFRPELPAQYAHQLFILEELSAGEQSRADREHAEALERCYSEAEQELAAFTRSKSVEKTAAKMEKRGKQLADKQQELADRLCLLTEKTESAEQWIRSRRAELEPGEKEVGIHREAMEHARYLLSRIESTVFEQEVWNTLAPIKQKYQIQTLQVEMLPDGHQKESRILYKSDLLFYIKIYAQLHPDAHLSDYRMLCIDEGQDLHKADYDLLRQLYPKAVFNVFGDTEQVLHTACGIRNWTEETGIDLVYTLNKNYRNTAGIVDFCNSTLKSQMDYIGRPKPDQSPQILQRNSELRSALEIPGITVILRNREMLTELCRATGKEKEAFAYFDTHAESTAGGRIPCYSIFAAKGLEFQSVLVYGRDMTKNQRVVACTRAMRRLYYYG